jgi:phosphate transport system substrate-binding protein
MDQVAKVFTTGNSRSDIGRWGQIGGTAAWKSSAIHPVTTPEYTGFGSYLEQTHFNHMPFAPGVQELPNSAEILKRVGEDAQAIGIAASGRTGPNIKMVALADATGGDYSNGTVADVAANKYPLGRFLYFYIRREPGKPIDRFVKEYFRLILSKEGQEIIASQKDGYIPLTAKQAAEEIAKLEVTK